MDAPVIDPHFAQCFDTAKFLIFYIPLNPYRRFLGNISRREYLTGLLVHYFVLFSQLVLILLYALFILNSTCNNKGDFLVTVATSLWLILDHSAFLCTWWLFVFGQDVADLIAVIYEAFKKSREESAEIAENAENWTRDWAKKMIVLRNLFVPALVGMLISPIIRSIIKFANTGQWENELPLHIWLPFEGLTMPIYPLVYGVEIWFFLLNTCIIIATDAMVGSVAILISWQFKKVALQFRSITFGNYEADMGALIRAMQLHTEALNWASRARKTFSIIIFVTYLTASMVVCILVFLIVNETDLVINCQYLADLICYLMYVVLFGYYGNLVIESSTSVADAVFATNWMDADVRIQKMIIIIIKRSHSPESLTGMDFFAASFPSIAKILTTSYSYFTLLQSTYKK